MSVLTVSTLIEEKSKDLQLTLIAGSGGLNRSITVPDTNRPGLALAGYFEHLPYERIQIIGIGEHTFLKSLSYEKQYEMLNKIFSSPQVPCCIITRNFEPLQSMMDIFDKLNVPLISTPLSTAQLLGDLLFYLDEKLAPMERVHGVLCNVYGLGVFIRGKSGVGKSECALELVKRGHMLVSDDTVEITKRFGRALVGKSTGFVKHHMELRGVGIIDIRNMFGIANILDESKIELVINLVDWMAVKKYERLGIDEYYANILGVKVPEITIPVAPGRNLAVIVETASLNQRLKNKGCFAAIEMNKKLVEQMKNTKNEK